MGIHSFFPEHPRAFEGEWFLLFFINRGIPEESGFSVSVADDRNQPLNPNTRFFSTGFDFAQCYGAAIWLRRDET